MDDVSEKRYWKTWHRKRNNCPVSKEVWVSLRQKEKHAWKSRRKNGRVSSEVWPKLLAQESGGTHYRATMHLWQEIQTLCICIRGTLKSFTVATKWSKADLPRSYRSFTFKDAHELSKAPEGALEKSSESHMFLKYYKIMYIYWVSQLLMCAPWKDSLICTL